MDFVIWIAFGALVITLYEVTGLQPIMRRSILWGAYYGAMIGVFLGPIAIYLAMIVHHSLDGTSFLGLEIVAGPVVGAAALAPIGAVAGAIRGKRLTRQMNKSKTIDEI